MFYNKSLGIICSHSATFDQTERPWNKVEGDYVKAWGFGSRNCCSSTWRLVTISLKKKNTAPNSQRLQASKHKEIQKLNKTPSQFLKINTVNNICKMVKKKKKKCLKNQVLRIRSNRTLTFLCCCAVFSHQSCPTFHDPMDYLVHETLQARILERVTFPFSRGSSQPRDRTQVSRIAGGFFTS